MADQPADVRQEALLALCADRLVWGVILGSALRRVEQGESLFGRVADFARSVGADEQAAETHLEWLRHQPGL